MIKKLIEPFQIALLNRRLCAGCTTSLDKAPIREILNEKKILVQCNCRRRYILDRLTNTYRRASNEEEQEYLAKAYNNLRITNNE